MTELEQIAMGRTHQHIDESFGIHHELVLPWQHLQAAAAEQGFKLALASGFRGFDRQLAIWNSKCLGDRPVLDNQSRPLDLARLSPYEKVMAILRWSALPGASRHHWGSDIDIFDTGAVEPDYPLALVPSEYEGAGPFAPMSQWLSRWLSSSQNPGFFRPYARDTGGISPEPWHVSYRPLASRYQAFLTVDSLGSCLSEVDIEEKPIIIEHLEQIFDRFIKVGDV